MISNLFSLKFLCRVFSICISAFICWGCNDRVGKNQNAQPLSIIAPTNLDSKLDTSNSNAYLDTLVGSNKIIICTEFENEDSSELLNSKKTNLFMKINFNNNVIKQKIFPGASFVDANFSYRDSKNVVRSAQLIQLPDSIFIYTFYNNCVSFVFGAFAVRDGRPSFIAHCDTTLPYKEFFSNDGLGFIYDRRSEYIYAPNGHGASESESLKAFRIKKQCIEYVGLIPGPNYPWDNGLSPQFINGVLDSFSIIHMR